MDFNAIVHSILYTTTTIHGQEVEIFQPSLVWLGFEFLIVFLIIWTIKFFPKSGFSVLFDFLFEKVYDFFEDLLWKNEKNWIKMYVTILFFIILISNIFWVCLEIVLPALGLDSHWHALMSTYITIPTATKEFNIAMAFIWVFIVTMEQFKNLWAIRFILEYFPIFGKDYIPYTKGKLPPVIDYPLYWVIKIFDIIISVFLGILDIIWLVAKVISLSFRLFWNMFSWGILLAMLMWASVWLTSSIFADFNFPVIAPIIIYLQEMLVALIQAFVFPLLIAIFIKVAKLH